ncbi:putative proton-dependent oligopeptide transporter family, major facilitator superfamily [Medicago truncatula]|uniref:Putative proton-dependent oligopeptide transporter family, major facilitator superfamily n=2 Tax=Medicago truncatula TaxID=3880 RepID=A0A396JRR6_MEDTR|nr:protein NRT1/ PTR FAMILY 1.2 isoform X1 [Medicago truncatula]RHN79461.1 putative proton-dependent oligopeptide transporter family, major facilitator superfamily [Medicago truncatula]
MTMSIYVPLQQEEDPDDEYTNQKMNKEAQYSGDADEMASQPRRRKGGLITMPFIIANEALGNTASLGILPNMILYLMGPYNLHLGQANQILLLSAAAGKFMPVVGAFVADSYLGRFLSVGLGSAVSFLGMALLWLTAMIKPTEGDQSPTSWEMAMLISAFILISIASGGVSCSMAFGADQVNIKDNPNNNRVLEMFFSWYYAFASISAIIALTVIVYIQDHLGWKIGFGVPAALMFLSTLLFFLASPLYVKIQKRTNLFASFGQVIVASYSNRKLPLPPKNSPQFYHHNKDSDLVVPTDKLRFLNKACVIKEFEQDIACDGSRINPWNLCTVDQVEEFKAIVRVIPLWSSGIMMTLSMGSSFGLLQAKTLNRHITSNFEVPAGSLSVINIGTVIIWIVFYDRVLIPLASKIRGKPVKISAKKRMGIGLFLSFLYSVNAAIFETIRRRNANNGVLEMSALWLAPQLCLAGISEAVNFIGQNEFYYTEFPSTMSSVAASLSGLGMAAGSLVSSLLFSIVENTTSRGGKDGWISDDINKGHFDKYSWLIAGISAFNILYYIICSWAYGPAVEELSKD